MKTITLESLQMAFDIVAFASLIENNGLLNNDAIQTESARIERCVEHHYKIDKTTDLGYLEFAGKFLSDNYKDIIYSNKYIGSYLDDVKDNHKEDKEIYPAYY